MKCFSDRLNNFFFKFLFSVCRSMDIRNVASELKKLDGCIVVEGFVQIILMDRYTDNLFDNYTFPMLTEITDFLLLFRVNGLKTLNKLFPNLKVIRGNTLIKNYALVIYEMFHIEVRNIFFIVILYFIVV